MKSLIVIILCLIVSVQPNNATAQTAERSVVTIYAYQGAHKVSLGTGFMVAPGVLVTAYHVVEGAERIEIVPLGGKLTEAVLIRSVSPASDLALLTAPSLGSLHPLKLSGVIPDEAANLTMIGSAAGIPNSKYLAHLAHAGTIPISAFSDPRTGEPLYAGVNLNVLHIAGVIYGGLSGGPVLDESHSVIGLVCGSLNEGGSAGFAIPAGEVIQLMQSADSQLSVRPGLKWPRGIRSKAAKSLVYLGEIDGSVSDIVDNFTALSSRLNTLNIEISTKAFSVSLALINYRSAIDSYISVRDSETRSGLERRTSIDQLNAQVASGRNDQQEIGALRALLAERFSIDQKLRMVVSRLQKAADTSGVDQDNVRKIQRAVNNITSSDPEIATTTFENEKGIDRSFIIKALDYIAKDSNSEFSNYEDAIKFSDLARDVQDKIAKYNFGNTDWFAKENMYFDRAGSFIRQYRGVVVFVPES